MGTEASTEASPSLPNSRKRPLPYRDAEIDISRRIPLNMS